MLTLPGQAKINNLDIPGLDRFWRNRAVSESWIPKGCHTITPNIVVDDAEAAIVFRKRAFGASEHYRLTLANGKVTHRESRLGQRRMPAEGY